MLKGEYFGKSIGVKNSVQVGFLLTSEVRIIVYQSIREDSFLIFMKKLLRYYIPLGLLLSFGEFMYFYIKIKRETMRELDLQYPTCPIRNVLGRISDKWSLLILCSLHVNEKMRYKDLMSGIPDISHKVLTSSLKHLVEDHLLLREAYAEIPPRVEYSLSETGKSLMPAVLMMIDWAQQHFDDVTK